MQLHLYQNQTKIALACITVLLNTYRAVPVAALAEICAVKWCTFEYEVTYNGQFIGYAYNQRFGSEPVKKSSLYVRELDDNNDDDANDCLDERKLKLKRMEGDVHMAQGKVGRGDFDDYCPGGYNSEGTGSPNDPDLWFTCEFHPDGARNLYTMFKFRECDGTWNGYEKIYKCPDDPTIAPTTHPSNAPTSAPTTHPTNAPTIAIPCLETHTEIEDFIFETHLESDCIPQQFGNENVIRGIVCDYSLDNHQHATITYKYSMEDNEAAEPTPISLSSILSWYIMPTYEYAEIEETINFSNGVYKNNGGASFQNNGGGCLEYLPAWTIITWELPQSTAPLVLPTTESPTSPTSAPTSGPTSGPTSAPSSAPTVDDETDPPTSAPTSGPTSAPSSAPTVDDETDPETDDEEIPIMLPECKDKKGKIKFEKRGKTKKWNCKKIQKKKVCHKIDTTGKYLWESCPVKCDGKYDAKLLTDCTVAL